MLPPWSEIPLELAGLVLGRLAAHADRVRFAAVCPRWRAATREFPPPPALPLLALPDDDDGGTVYSPPLHQPFRLPAAAAGHVASCGSWLLFSSKDDGGGGGCCFLRNPFSDAMVPLPALHRVRRRYKQTDGSAFTCETNDASETRLMITRLLLCSPHLVAAYVVLGSRWDDGAAGKIPYMAVCQPGASPWWSVSMAYNLVSEEHVVPTLAAMAFHKGTLFAVERYRGRLYAVDIGVDQRTGDPWVSRFRQVIHGSIAPTSAPPTIALGNRGRMLMETLFYLVESRGALLMVRRQRQYQYQCHQFRKLITPTGWKEFDVFEADMQGSRWTKATIGKDQDLITIGAPNGICSLLRVKVNE